MTLEVGERVSQEDYKGRNQAPRRLHRNPNPREGNLPSTNPRADKVTDKTKPNNMIDVTVSDNRQEGMDAKTSQPGFPMEGQVVKMNMIVKKRQRIEKMERNGKENGKDKIKERNEDDVKDEMEEKEEDDDDEDREDGDDEEEDEDKLAMSSPINKRSRLSSIEVDPGSVTRPMDESRIGPGQAATTAPPSKGEDSSYTPSP